MLNVRLKNQHIKGSPSLFAVKLPEFKPGTSILKVVRASHPIAISVFQAGEMVVTEGGTGCVTVYDSRGQRCQSFGKFLSPSGVAIDKIKNRIFVADQNKHCIQKHTTEGKFLVKATIKGTGNVFPGGIAINPTNGKVYTATSKHLHILDSYDLSIFSTCKVKDPPEALSNPKHLTCDSTGNVYVVNEDHIQVFTAEGKFLRQIGKGRLMDPYGIAIDTSSRVYVSECSNACISVFTSEGQFLTSFGKEFLSHPRGIAVDISDVVYVCDQDKGIVLL